MRHDELICQAGIDSGVVRPVDGGGVECTACGCRSWQSEELAHAPDCAFVAAMSRIYDSMHAEATTGESDIADAVLQDVLAAVPMDIRLRIDGILDRLAMARDVPSRMVALADLEAVCPGMDKNLLVGYAAVGMRNDAARRRLRALAMYEVYSRKREDDILFEIARLQQSIRLMSGLGSLDDAR